MNISLDNKICLITGATAGIGEVTARELARLGAQVVVVGRNPQKCARVADAIRRETNNDKVTFLVGDLSELAQVRRVADDFNRQFSRLDVLVNNAGAYFERRQVTADGLEATFALNHMSYFLLTVLLEAPLKAARARVVNVSSAAHFAGRVNLEDLQLKHGYNGWAAYSNSKLMNVLFTYALARRWAEAGVTANAVHPGFVATSFGHNNRGFIQGAFNLLQKMVAISPEQGAQTSLHLATSPNVDGVTGKYFADRRAQKSSPISYDTTLQDQLWQTSLNLAGLATAVPG